MKPTFLLIAILHVSVCFSQVTISGFVEDSQTKERLSGVTIFDINSKRGTISNSFGFYSLSFLHNDTTQLIYSYVGYKKQIIQILPIENMILNIQLESGIELTEVVVTH